jgi:hypothetical protein
MATDTDQIEIDDSASPKSLTGRLGEKITVLRERRIAETSKKYRPLMRRAIFGDATPRGAIKAFCLHCTGDLRDQITNCTAYACPLYEYRPYQAATSVTPPPEDDEPEPDEDAAS